MALDAATLALTAAELKATLTDAKIAKIFEPTRDELVITLRTRTDTYALLLSARSGSARVCLTEETFENPDTPPSFCMLMRKHLTGGRLLDVHMEPGDRIVYFDFQCTNEMGDLVRNTLCAELMGRYSNLVLVQNGKIIDALKRVDFEDSDVRQLLPGLPYTTPPKPARPDFLLVSSASIVAAACQRELPVAEARMDAGVLNTLVVKKVSRLTFMKFVTPYSKGQYYKFPHLARCSTPKVIRIRSEKPDIVPCLDGECITSDDVTIQLSDKRLNFFGPAGCSCNRTARKPLI